MTRIRQGKPRKARRLPARRGALAVASALFFAVLFAANLGMAVNAESAKSPRVGTRILTTAREAHDLSVDQAQRGHPIHLRGVVTYFDPDYGGGNAAIFIHDRTGSIFVRAHSDSAGPLAPGLVIDVRGISSPGGFGSIVVNPQIRILGRASLPPNPPRVSLALLKTGAYDAQWVEVEGSVHRVDEYSHSVTLRLVMRDGTISVTMIREPGASYSGLVDSQVRIRANAAPTMSAEGLMIGVRLQAPNLSALRVIEPAPSDPFTRPAVPIDGLLRWGRLSTSSHRVHLRGNVTLQWPGASLCIRDSTRGICAQTNQANLVAVGDLVDMVGFVETDNNAPFITDAVFRIAGSNNPVEPQTTTAEEILQGGGDSKLIQVEGLLVGQDLASTDATLLLSSGEILFPAVLPKNLAGPEAGVWKIGSRLRVTGICSVRIDAESHVREGVAVIKSFRVLLRSPGDVTILRRPSWWTPQHAILLLSLALTLTLAVLGWVAVLRKRIQRQANLLRESEQQFRHMALHDALTGLATRLLLQDRLEVALKSAKRRHAGLAVLMLDLDNFKEINDTYGHLAGDEVLRVTAQRLLQVVRVEDTVARLGGDEFVVLIQYLSDLPAAERIAAAIVETLAVPIPIDGREVPVSVSVGICAVAAESLDSVDLLRSADAALYSAKAGGRNRFQSHPPNLAPIPTA